MFFFYPLSKIICPSLIMFFFLYSISFELHGMDKRWLGTSIDELNRMPQCAPPLSHLKVVPNHTVTIRVSLQPLVLAVRACMWGGLYVTFCGETTLCCSGRQYKMKKCQRECDK